MRKYKENIFQLLSLYHSESYKGIARPALYILFFQLRESSIDWEEGKEKCNKNK